MKPSKFFQSSGLALLLATQVAAAEAPVAAQRESSSIEAARMPERMPASRAEEARYARREAASPEAKKFRGGDVIVISASAIAIVLLIVLIIVLI